MNSSKTVFLLVILLFLPVSSPQAGNGFQLSTDTLFFKSFSIEGKHYLVKIVFSNEKTMDVQIQLKDSSGVLLQNRSMKAKLYPVRENETAPVLFDAEVFTGGYHCPVMIYIERLIRLQLYIDDAGCFAGETLTPSQFGTMMREK